MNQTNPATEFQWISPLGISIILFLISGILHLLIGILTPFLSDSEISRKILMISNRTDTIFFGTEPSKLLEINPELDKLRAVLSPIIGGWLITIGIFTIVVAWYGLRYFHAWSLITLSVCGVILAIFWIMTMWPYLNAGIKFHLSDLPPIFWIPAITLIPAVILGWLGLK